MSQPAPPSPAGLPDEADVVVIGAGHNALVCAGYLAVAGLEVLVLEASRDAGRQHPDRGAHPAGVRPRLLLQRARADPVQPAGPRRRARPARPLRAALPAHRPRGGDAAGRRRRPGHAPRPRRPPPTRSPASPRPTPRRSGRWSPSGAAGSRPRTGGGAPALPLGDDDATRRYLDLRGPERLGRGAPTASTHPAVRAFVLWLAMATIQDPRRPGTGFLPSSLTAGRLSFGWATPVGGSQALPDALVRLLEDHGGRVVCSSPVVAVEADADGVRRVRTDDGRSVRARRAVVAGGHLARLAGMLEGVAAAGRPGPGAGHVAARAQRVRGARRAAGRPDLRRRGRCAAPPPGSAPLPASPARSTRTAGARPTRPTRGCSSSTRPSSTRAAPRTAARRSRSSPSRPTSAATGADWAEAKEEYGAALLDLVRRRATGLDEADILAWRAESPVDVAAAQPAQRRRLLPRRRVPPRRARCCRAGRRTAPRSPACSSPAPPRTRAGRCPAGPGATPRARSSPTSASTP